MQKSCGYDGGADVGINRGMMASFGLWAMGKATSIVSQSKIAKMFMQAAASNANLNAAMIE